MATGSASLWEATSVAGGTVTITITGQVSAATTPGTIVNNQGTIGYDSHVDGANDATAQADNPVGGGAADPASFTVVPVGVTPTGVGGPVAPVPVNARLALIVLAVGLADLAAFRLRRRRT